MAIQIPNAGTGNGATGDNEFVLWTKVINNFSDQTNAASRLLGTGAEQVPLSKNIPSLLGTAATKNVGTSSGNVVEVGAFGLGKVLSTTTLADLTKTGTGLSSYVAQGSAVGATDIGGTPVSFIQTSGGTVSYQTWRMYGAAGSIFYQHSLGATEGWAEAQTLYHTKNTTKDANGFLKGASPIVKVFADKVELNGEAEDQDVSYKKNGVGDYTITTASGLSTDGWYIELPKDMNGNPKVAVTLSEVDGVISLKTYKRIFSMETFTFEPDLDNPLDIPDTRWIDIRLNEIPIEIPDDIQTEV